MNFRFLLKLNSHYVYILTNLNNFEIFNRDLQLLFHVKFDQVKQHMKVFPHVEYDKLFRKIARIIEQKIIIEKYQIKKSKVLFKLIYLK